MNEGMQAYQDTSNAFQRALRHLRSPGRSVVDGLYNLLGGEWCGNVTVPLDNKTLRINGQVVSFSNDAFEVYLGTPNEWRIYFNREDFLKVCAWFLFQWAVCDCFGLRRKVWYWALGKRVARWTRPLEATGTSKEGASK